MYQYFYLTALIAAALLGLMTIIATSIGKLHTKLWRNILIGLGVIAMGSMICFIVALM